VSAGWRLAVAGQSARVVVTGGHYPDMQALLAVRAGMARWRGWLWSKRVAVARQLFVPDKHMVSHGLQLPGRDEEAVAGR
jgi:hypothetical protein